MTETPQLYLITPPVFDPQAFAPRLAAVLDAHPVACLRLTLATSDETDVTRAADALREVAHARDVPLVITTHLQLVEKLGLDGVHLTDGARSVRKTRKELGADPIVGAFCAASSHEGMTAGEAGADYIAFGPAGDSALGDGTRAGHDLFAWWSEMIELPVVAEGALDTGLIETLAPVVDFFAIGEEIWREDDAPASLSRLTAPLR
ncbi:thiamine phosphate synthase [Rhodophyticola porphyridii]|uniref:Thiamine phosphate synthase n=1 Tax=Rhodophyticola porphyridii TaxID=1852017 RepID=A0A3L9Y7W1_9RHOB|nr:thiamine phosphate synthase [Rhodophyticola porphyridii]RMA42383.1 thiamine phosphate synthase [Rhodophyticola porphyridii]